MDSIIELVYTNQRMNWLVVRRLPIRSASCCTPIGAVQLCTSTTDADLSFVASRPHPLIDKIIRVNHAGEFGAIRLYAGQSSFTEKPNIRLTIEVQVPGLIIYNNDVRFSLTST